MLAPLDLLDQLKASLAEGIEALPLASGGGAVSLILALPRVPTRLPHLDGPQFQFRHDHREELCVGYGSVAEWQAHGPDRLRRLALAARGLAPHWERLDPEETGFDAFAMLGFAASAEPAPMFEDHLPNAIYWLPEVGVRVRRDEAALVFSARRPIDADRLATRWVQWLDAMVPQLYLPAEGLRRQSQLERDFAEPDRSGWVALVEEALEQIAQGDLQKVVLSRRLDVIGRRVFDVHRLVGALSRLFPSCHVVNLRRNGSSFVAATPERLLTQKGRAIEVDAIAGTTARASDLAEDMALADALRRSDKNLREHRFVIDAISDALQPSCGALDVPDQPQLMRLSNAQHLWSPVRAQAEETVDLFDLAAQLHPTPATNGHPRHAASAWLQRVEPFQRGWYTGAAGLVAPDLSGELWVLLRCARVCGDRAELYAGAGLVAGSDPHTEWDETEAKLNAMLTALQYA